MPNYGSYAQRVPAKGGANLTDIDIYKVALLCKTERGIVDANGYPVVHDEIYSMNDFYKKCGGNNSSYYGSYVAKSFFDELENSINCEMKVLSYVDTSAAQASYSILDEAGSAIFTISAGRRGLDDKSAFGNKMAIKITQIEDITMKLTAELVDSATTATLDNVDNLEIGNYIKFEEGNDVEVRAITDINTSTKTVTFAALTESGGFSVSGTTVTRLDWRLELAIKDDLGNYQKIETWQEPFAKSDTVGLAGEVNDTEAGSNFIILAVNSSNTSNPDEQIPAELTSWTALSGGSDGSSPSDSTWDTLADTYLSSTEFTILLAPESSSITHNQNMSGFTTDGYKGIFYAQSSNGATEDTLKNFGASLRGGIVFAMLPADKWIKVNDPTKVSGTKDIPMTGIAAAHWFNTYLKFGESKVAAGNKSEMVLKANGKLIDTNGLVHDDADGVGGRLIRNYSVNICKFTRGKGITINSARTFSTDDGYKFQNQIFQWILYSRSIVAFLRNLEQDRSSIDGTTSHRRTVVSYMNRKYKAGHLFKGQKEDGTATVFNDVCIIVNDFTINTLANINNGQEEVFMQAVFPPPIEELILSLASAGVTSVSG
jgi:hypothetical protein